MNQYDNKDFFDEYAKMPRSTDGLKSAGEWQQLQQLFPELNGKRVLDLGCGYGWHCAYAAKHGAKEVIGIDSSERMLSAARKRNPDSHVNYELCSLENYRYPCSKFDLVISNLALHYVEDLDSAYKMVWQTLVPGGIFLFNIEHPTFTAGVGQDWIYDKDGNPEHWPVDNYFYPGKRKTRFLGRDVTKQHHTLTQILMGLIHTGFQLEAVIEAEPPRDMLSIPGMKDELRRPMMLLVRARKSNVFDIC